MTDKQIKEQLGRINARRVLFAGHFCKCGIVGKYIAGGKVIAVTSCTGLEYSDQFISRIFFRVFYAHLGAGRTYHEAYRAGALMMKTEIEKAKASKIAGYEKFNQTPQIAGDEATKSERLFERR